MCHDLPTVCRGGPLGPGSLNHAVSLHCPTGVRQPAMPEDPGPLLCSSPKYESSTTGETPSWPHLPVHSLKRPLCFLEDVTTLCLYPPGFLASSPVPLPHPLPTPVTADCLANTWARGLLQVFARVVHSAGMPSYHCWKFQPPLKCNL